MSATPSAFGERTGEYRNEHDESVLVYAAPGTFQQGTPDEGYRGSPRHAVSGSPANPPRRLPRIQASTVDTNRSPAVHGRARQIRTDTGVGKADSDGPKSPTTRTTASGT